MQMIMHLLLHTAKYCNNNFIYKRQMQFLNSASTFRGVSRAPIRPSRAPVFFKHTHTH